MQSIKKLPKLDSICLDLCHNHLKNKSIFGEFEENFINDLKWLYLDLSQNEGLDSKICEMIGPLLQNSKNLEAINLNLSGILL